MIEKKGNGEERKTSMEEITLQVNKSDPKGGKTVEASQERRQRKKWVHSLLFFLLENFHYLCPPSRSQEEKKRKEIEKKKDGEEKNEKIATCRHDEKRRIENEFVVRARYARTRKLSQQELKNFSQKEVGERRKIGLRSLASVTDGWTSFTHSPLIDRNVVEYRKEGRREENDGHDRIFYISWQFTRERKRGKEAYTRYKEEERKKERGE